MIEKIQATSYLIMALSFIVMWVLMKENVKLHGFWQAIILIGVFGGFAITLGTTLFRIWS